MRRNIVFPLLGFAALALQGCCTSSPRLENSFFYGPGISGVPALPYGTDEVTEKGFDARKDYGALSLEEKQKIYKAYQVDGPVFMKVFIGENTFRTPNLDDYYVRSGFKQSSYSNWANDSLTFLGGLGAIAGSALLLLSGVHLNPDEDINRDRNIGLALLGAGVTFSIAGPFRIHAETKEFNFYLRQKIGVPEETK